MPTDSQLKRCVGSSSICFILQLPCRYFGGLMESGSLRTWERLVDVVQLNKPNHPEYVRLRWTGQKRITKNIQHYFKKLMVLCPKVSPLNKCSLGLTMVPNFSLHCKYPQQFLTTTIMASKGRVPWGSPLAFKKKLNCLIFTHSTVQLISVICSGGGVGNMFYQSLQPKSISTTLICFTPNVSFHRTAQQ